LIRTNADCRLVLPDFLIVGQTRAATSTLYQYLRQHPQVFMPEIKDLRFFNHALDAPNRASLVPRGLPVTLEDYAAHFESAPESAVKGEASPLYVDSMVAARQIREVLPDARLICCLRNPVDRIYSFFLLNQRRGSQRESFDDWLVRSNDRQLAHRATTCESLARFYVEFPREQIRVVLFEELTSSPRATVAGLFEWLGVDPQFQIDLQVSKNEGGVPKSRRLAIAVRAARSSRVAFPMVRRHVPHALLKGMKWLRGANLDRPPPLDPNTLQKTHDQKANQP
jgi:hypothetical protein